MTQQTPVDDDSSNQGTNNAPATGGANVNLPTGSQQIGNGQRQQSRQPGSNPLDTGINLVNPLSKFSSYTYSLTLYMLSPEALNYYTERGTLPSSTGDNGYIIIAQSGGINNEAEPRGLTFTGEPGPGQDGLDYYIDDLTFQSWMLAATGSKTPTTETTFSFKVIEPTGFTFLTKLSNASAVLNSRSSMVQASPTASKPNLYQQYYMLGIRFYGYDENGRMLDSSQVVESDKALNDKFALFQRFFPLQTNSLTFAINGRATVYSWECTLSHVQPSFGAKFGHIPNQVNVEGATVGEILGASNSNNEKSLIQRLNNIQKTRTDNKNQEGSITYNIEWVANEYFDSSSIFNSPMITQESSAETSAMAPVNNTQDVNVSKSINANTINKQSKGINFARGTSIVSAIDLVISRSAYVTDKLLKQVNDRLESQTVDNPNGFFRWYSIKPIVKILGRDDSRKDWSYNITYEIAPYEVPYIKNPYVTSRSKYYGPVKAYNYTFTGENTEVINFEMTYNNLFFTLIPGTTTSDNSGLNTQAVSPATPRAIASSVPGNPTAGSVGNGSIIADSVRANLYSLGDQAMATIRIMGDPDYLMDSIGTRNQQGSLSKFISPNNSINPYGGQIFIEIVFKVAEDYKDNGLLDVDEGQSILFYPFDQQSAIRNQGYIFKINSVTHNFSRGKFEQTLDLFMVSVTELYTAETEQQRQQPVNQSQSETRVEPPKPVVVKPTKQSSDDDAGVVYDAEFGLGATAVDADREPRTGIIPSIQNFFGKPRVRPGQGGTRQ